VSYPLPEQQPPRPVVGQRPPALMEGWPTLDDEDRVPAVYQPTPLAPAPEPRIVEYRRYGGVLVPVYEATAPVQPVPPRDLTPQPVLDPLAQRFLAGGIGGGALGAGVGWGASLVFGSLAGLPAGTFVALIALALVLRAPMSRRAGDTYHVTNNVSSRWWGKSTSITKES